MEDEAWYAEYEEAQADMARFLTEYELKKQEYQTRKDDIEAMAEGPAKDEALRLLQIMKEEMQKYQVQAETYRKQNEEYAQILQEKEERQAEIAEYEAEELDERYEDTLEAYVEVRAEYGEALYEFQYWQQDTYSWEFEEAQETLWMVEDTLNAMKWDINDMLQQRVEAEAMEYENQVRMARETADEEASDAYNILFEEWESAFDYWYGFEGEIDDIKYEIYDLQYVQEYEMGYYGCETTQIEYPCPEDYHWDSAYWYCQADDCVAGETWDQYDYECGCPYGEEWESFTPGGWEMTYYIGQCTADGYDDFYETMHDMGEVATI